MLKRLSHVCLGSTNVQRTVEFYSRLIGCRIAHEFRNPGGELYGVFLSCSNGTFLEFFNEQAPRPSGGLFRHLCFEVEDIHAMAEVARVNGFKPEVRRGRTDRILQFFVHDPDGNMIEFQQHDKESVLYPLIPEIHRTERA
jgi:catechol 2,3-dioxygenase-like lactoylglutathione lyase family enzyme